MGTQGVACPVEFRGAPGAGFDTASTRNGTGLQGMADRLAALGGGLQVRSRPGHGTTISGQLPVSVPGQG
jgi:glucose-6-phosphate-specific signal transduction histidine kinase